MSQLARLQLPFSLGSMARRGRGVTADFVQLRRGAGSCRCSKGRGRMSNPSPRSRLRRTMCVRPLRRGLGKGIAAGEIGVFVRTPQLIPRARAALAGLSGADGIITAPMSQAKGLEFRAVVVMACDEGILPLDERV